MGEAARRPLPPPSGRSADVRLFVSRRADLPHPPSPSVSPQTPILQFHSGYQKADLAPVVRKLHGVLSAPPDDRLRAIRNKYSHK